MTRPSAVSLQTIQSGFSGFGYQGSAQPCLMQARTVLRIDMLAVFVEERQLAARLIQAPLSQAR